MTVGMSTSHWGIWAPVVTPFDQNLSADPKKFCAHVETCLSQGAHGVVLFGTTGEAASLTMDERKSLLEQVVKNGIAPERLMVGTGRCALPDTVELTRHALAHGVATVLMLPPYYFKSVSEDGLYRSYAEVFDRVADPTLRVFLYHFPKLSQVPIPHAVIRRLINQYGDIVAGLKDSTGDEASTFGFIESFPELAILPGTERFLLAALLLGAKGCITASANVNAKALRTFWDAYIARSPQTESLQADTTKIRLALETAPTIPGLKAFLALKYQDETFANARPPLLDLTRQEADNLLKRLKEVGLNVDPTL